MTEEQKESRPVQPAEYSLTAEERQKARLEIVKDALAQIDAGHYIPRFRQYFRQIAEQAIYKDFPDESIQEYLAGRKPCQTCVVGGIVNL